MISDQKGLLTRSFRSSLVITKNLSIKDLQGTIILFSHPRGQAALGRKGVNALAGLLGTSGQQSQSRRDSCICFPREGSGYSTGVVCMRGGQGHILNPYRGSFRKGSVPGGLCIHFIMIIFKL